MKRGILIALFLSLIVPITEAQLWKMRRYEAAAGFGSTSFFGDVGGFSRPINILGLRDLSLLQTRFNLNLNLKFRITQEINGRLSLSYGILNADDRRGSNKDREYFATMSIFEPALIGEYYFLKHWSEDSYVFKKGRINRIKDFLGALDFYLFTGVGGLSYSILPNTALKTAMARDNMVNKGFTAIVPAGVGTTLIVTPDFNLGVEFGGRYALTDRLDGYDSRYSQYSPSNDVYYFFNLTVTYKMKTGFNGLPSFRR
jgi:hypothetical protein